jgi:hypothetical protein
LAFVETLTKTKRSEHKLHSNYSRLVYYHLIMAPNRKSLSALAQTLSLADLEGLQSTVQPKYLPLTHPATTPAAPEAVSQQSNADADADASYWEWSSEEDVPTETVCILSTANIVSNLIQSSSSEQEETLAEHDDYWTEGEQQQRVEEPVAAPSCSAPQHETASYWDWSVAEEEEHVTRSAVPCSQSYWTWESSPSAPVVVSTPNANADSDYWGWETSPQDVAKLVLATSVLSQIKKQQQRHSDSYWTWTDDHHEQYWLMPSTTSTTPAAAVAATGNKGYWEW